jgi:hypothetical protein
MDYEQKYLKYKQKYLELKNVMDGGDPNPALGGAIYNFIDMNKEILSGKQSIFKTANINPYIYNITVPINNYICNDANILALKNICTTLTFDDKQKIKDKDIQTLGPELLLLCCKIFRTNTDNLEIQTKKAKETSGQIDALKVLAEEYINSNTPSSSSSSSSSSLVPGTSKQPGPELSTLPKPSIQSVPTDNTTELAGAIYNFIKLNIEALMILPGQEGSLRRSTVKQLILNIKIAIDKYCNNTNCTDNNIKMLKSRIDNIEYENENVKYPSIIKDGNNTTDLNTSKYIQTLMHELLLLCCKIFILNDQNLVIKTKNADPSEIIKLTSLAKEYINNPNLINTVSSSSSSSQAKEPLREEVDYLPIHNKFILKTDVSIPKLQTDMNNILNIMRTITYSPSLGSNMESEEFENKYLFITIMNRINTHLTDLQNQFVIPPSNEHLRKIRDNLSYLSSSIEQIYGILLTDFDDTKTITNNNSTEQIKIIKL